MDPLRDPQPSLKEPKPMPNMGSSGNFSKFDPAVTERIAERERIAAPLRFAAEAQRAESDAAGVKSEARPRLMLRLYRALPRRLTLRLRLPLVSHR